MPLILGPNWDQVLYWHPHLPKAGDTTGWKAPILPLWAHTELHREPLDHDSIYSISAQPVGQGTYVHLTGCSWKGRQIELLNF